MKEEDREYFIAIQNGDMDKVKKMVAEKAKEKGFFDAIPEQTGAYITRVKKAPKKTVKVYKVFTLSPEGEPTALFVAGTEKLSQNVWLDAVDTYHFKAKNGKEYIPSTQNPYTEGGKTGGTQEIPDDKVREELIKRGYLSEKSKAKNITTLAYRPGFHAGTLPFFPQGGIKDNRPNAPYPNIHRYNQVVFECEVAADKDYTSEAENQPKARKKDGSLNAARADLQYMPQDGFYHYATNPLTQQHPELGAWVISGSIKINRALSQEECDTIMKEHGMKPQDWEGGKMDLSSLGYLKREFDAARKTLAPITYDDDGYIIPLSSRFDSTVKDVRYQRDFRNGYKKISSDRTRDERVVLDAEKLDISESGKNVFRSVRSSLAGNGSDAVKNTADLSAYLLARHADYVSNLVQKFSGSRYSAMDYLYDRVSLNFDNFVVYSQDSSYLQAAAMYRSPAKSFKEFRDNAISGKSGKSYFEIAGKDGSILTVDSDAIRHIQNGTHPLSDEEWDDFISNYSYLDYAYHNPSAFNEKGHPIGAKVTTESNCFGFVLSFTQSRRVFLKTALASTDKAIDHWIKKERAVVRWHFGHPSQSDKSADSPAISHSHPLSVINILDDLYPVNEQLQNQVIQGSTINTYQGESIVSLFKDADETTFAHEMGHVFLKDLEILSEFDKESADDLRAVNKWAEWNEQSINDYMGSPWRSEFLDLDLRIRQAIREGSPDVGRLKAEWRDERFARGFEVYLGEGKAPSSTLGKVFNKFKGFIQNIYNDFKRTGGKPSPAVENVMAKMINAKKEKEMLLR